MPSYLNDPGFQEKATRFTGPEHYYDPLKDFIMLTACLENKEWEDAIAICTRLIHESKNESAHGWCAGMGIGENRIMRAPPEVQEAVRLANRHADIRLKEELEKEKKRGGGR